jgi:choline dehydrogenase-like flavoprotein
VMSGFFLRCKPDDFKPLSAYGPVPGADVVDWPIAYDDLEPYYEKVEREVGISGRVTKHPFSEPRSTAEFPYPPLGEHAFARLIDETGAAMGLSPVPLPRAILSKKVGNRDFCAYTGYCGSYGCTTGAKGSSRAALLDRAVATGRCDVRPRCQATKITTDASGRATGVTYVDADGATRQIDARVVVVACQAIESSRLLLASAGSKHPRGIGNQFDQVGRRILFSPDGGGWGLFKLSSLPAEKRAAILIDTPFVNRSLQDAYVISDPKLGRRKGGTIDFLRPHPNPIATAMGVAHSQPSPSGAPLWGWPLKHAIERLYREARVLRFENFLDWQPMTECRVTLDPDVRDRFGQPVARVKIDTHPWNTETSQWLNEYAMTFLRRMGAESVGSHANGGPSTNLQAGGCRFGLDPKSSVLDPDCRVHDAPNVFVTDGSFLPTGGSVPYTWTIYANAFRVSEKIVAELGGSR